MKLIRLFKKDLLVYYKSFFAMLIISVLISGVFALAILGNGEALSSKKLIKPFNIAVLNKDTSEYMTIVMSQIRSESMISEVINVSSLDEGKKLLEKGSVIALLLFDEFTIQKMLMGEKSSMQIITSPNNPIESAIMYTGFKNIANGLNTVAATTFTVWERSYIINDFSTANTLFNETQVALIGIALNRDKIIDTSSVPETSPLNFYLSTSLILFAMFAAMLAARLVAGDKRDGLLLLQHRFGVGVSLNSISKATMILLFSGFGLVLMFFATKVLLNINIYFSITNSILLFAGVYIAFFGIFNVIVALFSFNASEVINNLILVFFAVAGGVLYPKDFLPDYLREFAANSPTGVGMKALYNVVTLTSNDILGAMLYLMLAGIICILISTVIVRNRISSYGRA